MEEIKYSINGYDLILPIGLEKVLHTKVRDSYQDFLQTDPSLVRRHLTAATTLLPKYAPLGGTGVKVLHVFGGVGASAQILDQAAGRVLEHTFWERDPVLVDYLKKSRPNDKVLHTQDSYTLFLEEGVNYLSTFDIILFDPSVGTIKTPKMKDVWTKLGDLQPQMIWLSDTACAKIHLNYKTYQKDFNEIVEPSAEGYMIAYDKYLRTKGLHIAEAMREAAETYAVILPGAMSNGFPLPIAYM
jgi:hypothetical protein